MRHALRRPRARAGAAPALLLALLLAGTAATAADTTDAGPGFNSPVGLWETISDVDGKPKGHVRIREVEGELRGTIEFIVDPARRDRRCDLCTDERRDQPVQGMTVLTGMHREEDHYAGGRILDPDNGSVYRCRMSLVDGGRHLEVRGFIGISLFGRTQTWNRLE